MISKTLSYLVLGFVLFGCVQKRSTGSSGAARTCESFSSVSPATAVANLSYRPGSAQSDSPFKVQTLNLSTTCY